MTIQGWILILTFFVVLLAITKPAGLWLYAIYDGRPLPVLGWLERGFYRLSGVDPKAEMSWRRYAVHMLVFNALLALFTYAILRLQPVCEEGAVEHVACTGRIDRLDGACRDDLAPFGGGDHRAGLP